MKRSNKKSNATAKVHPELNGLNIQINSFGEVVSSFPIDKINDFLNKTVRDKKLEGIPGMSGN